MKERPRLFGLIGSKAERLACGTVNGCRNSLGVRGNVHFDVDSIADRIGSDLQRILRNIECFFFRPRGSVALDLDRLAKLDHAFEKVMLGRVDTVSRVAVDVYRLQLRLNCTGTEAYGFDDLRSLAGQKFRSDAIG